MENGKPYPPIVRFWYYFYFLIARLSASSEFFQRKISRFGETAAWVRTVKKINPNEKLEIFVDKDQLRMQACRLLLENKTPTVVLEFGVASGNGAKWWMKNLNESIVQYHGFDRFTGLPRSWRGLNEGHFSTNGETPDISDDRFTWHVGDVEKTFLEFITLNKEILDVERNYKLVVVLDLDIHEPTEFVYKQISPFLKKGDVIHFDEAFDSENELIIFKQFVKDFNIKILGITAEAVTSIID